MEKLKKIIRRALYPGTAVVLISIPVGIGSLCYSFLIAGEDTLVAYISYLVSAYALAIVCLGIAPVVRKVSRAFMSCRMWENIWMIYHLRRISQYIFLWE